MSAESTARTAWGQALPDWVLVLARACDAGSQADVARGLDYSPAVVSQTLSRKYRGALAQVEARVRRTLMAGRLACPVLDEIDGRRCLEEQRRPLSTASSLRVRLWRACRTCPHNLHKEARG